MNHLVSVVIPNYNHSRYLPQRIESVLNQTYQNLEIILLDDCSPDNSREIIMHYAALDGRINPVFNEQNSGSTFKQWNKGIALAQGKYVWLAESDDYADERFLGVLVARLEADATVGLVYADSWNVDLDNKRIGDWAWFYEGLETKQWVQDFVLPGKQLLKRYMSYRNLIPNASAVLIRRTILNEIGPADETFRVNGDWVFWAKIMRVSNIAFVAQRLNYFRQHTNNVRSTTVLNGTALIEQIRMLQLLKKLTTPEPYFLNRMLDFLVNEWLTAFIEYQVAPARHIQIYAGFKAVDSRFIQRFKRQFAHRMFPNMLSGLRQLLGDGLLYRLWKKRPVVKP